MRALWHDGELMHVRFCVCYFKDALCFTYARRFTDVRHIGGVDYGRDDVIDHSRRLRGFMSRAFFAFRPVRWYRCCSNRGWAEAW